MKPLMPSGDFAIGDNRCPVEAEPTATPSPRTCSCLAENKPGASWCAACGEPLSMATLVDRLPVVEYQIPIGAGGEMRWRQARHGRTRTWQGGAWSAWGDGLDDPGAVDRVAGGGARARIVPADRASEDPTARV